MAEKFRNRYRIKSARHPNWDYSQNAAYFITICTRNRESFFGHIENHEMATSDLGQYAHECWQVIPNHFLFVRLGAFVVMPNHVHGIIIIDKPIDGDDDCRDAKFCVSTAPPPPFHRNKFGPQSRNLASVVRGYKIGAEWR
jgi:putative transposase